MIGLQRKIVKLVPYSPGWKSLFTEEERLLRTAIGTYVVDIQHVGSTAIPGLEAKPIIDIAVALRRREDVEQCIEPLERLGYEYDEEHPDRHFFAKGDPSRRTHYLHMVEWNSEAWRSYIRFRDYLRQHKEMAEEYARLKRELARKSQGNRDLYTLGKAEFIESVLRMAEGEINPVKLFLDTDIGGDIDDAWALAACISHPGIELVGVTTVHGDTEGRAALARLLLKRAHAEVEVVAGTRDALDGMVPLQRPCYADVLGPEETSLRRGRTDAIPFMAQMAREHEGLVLCAIGPLTNVARFALEFPEEFSRVSRLVLMCGHLLPGVEQPEYNAGADPRATRIVLATGVPKYLVGLDVTLRCKLSEKDLEALRAKGTPLSETLYQMTHFWEGKTGGRPIMHDPLALLSTVEEGLVRFQPMRIETDERGRMRRLEGEPNAHVAVACDPERLRRFLLESLADPGCRMSRDSPNPSDGDERKRRTSCAPTDCMTATAGRSTPSA